MLGLIKKDLFMIRNNLKIVAIIFIILTSFPLGIIAALNKGKFIDKLISGVISFGLIMPGFVLGAFILYIFFLFSTCILEF